MLKWIERWVPNQITFGVLSGLFAWFVLTFEQPFIDPFGIVDGEYTLNTKLVLLFVFIGSMAGIVSDGAFKEGSGKVLRLRQRKLEAKLESQQRQIMEMRSELEHLRLLQK